MSYEGNNNRQPVENKINSYLYIFIAFIVITLAVFLGFRYGIGDGSSSKAASSVTKSDSVVVTKDPNLAVKKQKLLKDVSGDAYLGNQYAPVLVIEYASLSCPHCAHFEEDVVEPLIPNYIDSGKVRYVFRDFPLNPPAVAAAKLAHCADSDKYFSFIKVLFKSQKQWVNDSYLATLKNIGKLGGISDEKFDQCQNDKAIEDKIFKEQQDAVNILEVQATPTIFINGVQYKGKYEYKAVADYIDKDLKGDDSVAKTDAPAASGSAAATSGKATNAATTAPAK